MKKAYIVPFFLLVAIVLASCSSNSPTSSNSTVPAATFAESIALMAQSSCSIDDSIQEGTLVASGVRALSSYTYSTPEVGVDQWWAMDVNYSSASITLEINANFKVYTLSGAVISIIDLATLESANITTFEIFATYDILQSGGSYLLSLGTSKSAPFIVNILGQSLTGPITYTGTYVGIPYVIYLTYNVEYPIGSSYPNGSVTTTVYVNNIQVCTGIITFNGTSTATLVFGGGYSGTYSINLTNGTVTAN